MRHQNYLLATIVVLGLSLSLGVKAQSPFDWQRSADGRPFVSAQSDPQEVRATSAYSSTIYAVGTDEVPSAAYDPSAEQAPAHKPGIHTFTPPSDPGQSQEYPVGEPLVLLAFALLFAGLVAYRRVKKERVRE